MPLLPPPWPLPAWLTLAGERALGDHPDVWLVCSCFRFHPKCRCSPCLYLRTHLARATARRTLRGKPGCCLSCFCATRESVSGCLKTHYLLNLKTLLGPSLCLFLFYTSAAKRVVRLAQARVGLESVLAGCACLAFRGNKKQAVHARSVRYHAQQDNGQDPLCLKPA